MAVGKGGCSKKRGIQTPLQTVGTMTQFLFKSRVGNETRLKKLTEVSNYGNFIRNIFGWDTVKIGIIRAKVQISVWI